MTDLSGSRFTDILPENLAGQLEVQAIAYAVGRQIEKLCAYADAARSYAAIDTMPERLLDILAVELRTLGYAEDYPISVKRAAVRETMSVYTSLGTKWAVKQVVETYFGVGDVWEWFEYGGEPFHFTVVTTSDVSGDTMASFLETLASAKNERSILDEVITAPVGTWDYYDYIKRATWDDLERYTWDEVEEGI